MPAVFYGIPSGWIVLLLIAAWLIGSMYIYAPFKIRRQQSKDIGVDYQPIELPQLPPEVAQAFYDAARGLVGCGFHALGHLTHHTHKTAQNSYVSIWLNPSANDEAQVIGVMTPSQLQGLRVVTLVTFRTQFTDASSIVTSNTSSPGVFPRDPKVSAVRCPGIRDFALLYRFHRARVDRDRAGRTPSLAHVKDARARMESEYNETYDRLMKAGYYTLNESQQRYVPTLKGAFFMTYRLLPPFKQIQKQNRDQLAERTLYELGFGGMEAFRRSQGSTAPGNATSAHV
jgi:hypothetical protein